MQFSDFLLQNIPSVICVLSAAYLANKGIDGWGWFLFVGFLIANVPKS